jgi:multiple sugar transport system permease protein
VRRARRLAPVARHAALLAWSAFVLFPIFWMVSTSFKESWEWVAWPPHWLPHEPTLQSYRQIFTFSEMGRDLARSATDQVFAIWAALGDSLLVCTASSLVSLLMGTFLAYSISRFGVGGVNFRYAILTLRMVPRSSSPSRS